MRRLRMQLVGSVAIIIVSMSVIAPQIYLALNPQVHLQTTIFVGTVVAPIVLATVLFLGLKMRIVWFAFMAYIWAVTEDAPVYLDSIFTWPEVTSGLQHLFLEVLLHLLTLFFISLTVREAFRLREKRIRHEESLVTSNDSIFTRISKANVLLIVILALLAFVLSYAQNLPISSLKSITGPAWYRLDIAEHIISVLLLYLAVKFTLNTPKVKPRSVSDVSH